VQGPEFKPSTTKKKKKKESYICISGKLSFKNKRKINTLPDKSRKTKVEGVHYHWTCPVIMLKRDLAQW
jgi:hypothetical protein